MSVETVMLLGKVATFLVFLPLLVVALKRWKGTREQNWLSNLILLCFFSEMTIYILVKIFQVSNLPVFHFFIPIEFTLIALIYKRTITNYLSSSAFYGLIIAFVIGSILNTIFHEPLTKFNAYARAVEAILIIVFSLMYFYNTIIRLTDTELEKSPLFWISVGTIFYYSGTLFINIYSNILFGQSANSYTIWGLHAILSILLYIFYTIALWVNPKA